MLSLAQDQGLVARVRSAGLTFCRRGWVVRGALRTIAWPLALAAAGCGLGPPVGEASGSPAAIVSVVAERNAFTPQRVTLPSGAVVGVALENRDPGILHNVAIYPTTGGDPLFRGETFTGIATVTYVVAPLPGGTYRLVCDVHPGMEASLVVAPAGL